MPKRHLFGFIADPLKNFDLKAETTLFIMDEIQKRGHTIFVCEPKDLFLKQNELWGSFKQLAVTHKKQFLYRVVAQRTLALGKFSCLFLRKDPPFDLAYLHHLYLLMKLDKKVLMINEPSAILEFNEKLMALDFPFAPKTLVSAQTKQILEWGKNFANGIVLKPLNCGGGTGIQWIKKSKVKSQKSKMIVQKMTRNESQPIICQGYLSAAKNGDKRILMWNGKLSGAYARKPKPGEFRANIHQGGRFVECTLTPHDKKIINKVGPWLKSKGLYFAGLDVIGKHLTEINVTSPMGIREINTLYKKQLEREILDSILKRI